MPFKPMQVWSVFNTQPWRWRCKHKFIWLYRLHRYFLPLDFAVPTYNFLQYISRKIFVASEKSEVETALLNHDFTPYSLENFWVDFIFGMLLQLLKISSSTHFMPLVSSYTPWKSQKISRGTIRGQWQEVS